MRTCAQLSPECTDLLNKIFVIDEKARITIAQIKEHPWYGVTDTFSSHLQMSVMFSVAQDLRRC